VNVHFKPLILKVLNHTAFRRPKPAEEYKRSCNFVANHICIKQQMAVERVKPKINLHQVIMALTFPLYGWWTKEERSARRRLSAVFGGTAP